MPSSSRRVFIIVKAPNGDVREVPVGAAAVVIGRDESADIRVEDKKVSRRHASFKLIDGEPWVEDLGSANGVKLNGKRIDKRARITADDKVRVGGYQVTLKDLVEDTGSSVMDDDRRGDSVRSGGDVSVSRPIARDEVTPSRTAGLGATAIKPKKSQILLPDDGKSPVLEAIDEPVKGLRFVLHAGENIIGRLEECDIAVLDGSVSRQHARVVFARERLTVADLGSSNGTFVNDQRVETAELANGDSLRIGNIRFKVEAPPELSRSGSAPVKTKTRARAPKDGAATGRSWAVAGVAVLLLAIAVLSFTIYWKWRARQAQNVIVSVADAGVAAPDASAPVRVAVAEPERTIEPVKPPPERTIERTVEPVLEKPDASARVVETVTASESIAAEPAVTSTHSFAFAQVVTATAPFGAKDMRGMPLNLPSVDERFDYDAFVPEKLAAAQAIEKDGDFAKLRDAVSALLTHDPINTEGRAMWARVVLHENAVDALTKGDKLLARGEVARALKLYASVPEAAPESVKAKAKIEELKTKAVDQELDKADRDLKAKGSASWLRAHRRYSDILELDPESARALEGVRAAERKLRAKNLRFTAYVPAGAGQPAKQETPEDIDQALSKHFSGDEGLARVAQLYAKGDLKGAAKKAEAVEKRADGDRKDSAKRMRAAMKAVQALQERIRNEISNDPNQAWMKLMDLERAEGEILPANVKSYVRKDLEDALAEAFGDSGRSFFDRQLYEEAFQRWEAGFKLDPTNPKVIAGLKKLEDEAVKLHDEAEKLAQKGDRKACDRWKAITHITRGESEEHKRALDRARAGCGGN